MPAQVFLFGAFPYVLVFKSAHKSSSCSVILSAEFRLCTSLNLLSLWQGRLNLPHPQAIKEDGLFGVKLKFYVQRVSLGSLEELRLISKLHRGGCTAIKNLESPSRWLRWWLALVLPGSLKSSFCEPFLPILLAFYPKTLCQTGRKGGKEKMNSKTLK